MFEVIVNAFFLAQPLQQREVAFLVLNAKRPQGIVAILEFEAVAVDGQAVVLQQLTQDHRHAELLENASRSVPVQRLKGRHQHQFVTDSLLPAMFVAGAVQHTVNALMMVDNQQRRLLQQPLKGQGRCESDGFDIESIGLVEGLAATELHHLQTQVVVEKCQGEGTFLVVVHRARFYRGGRVLRVRDHERL